jgi:hypothetical protein
LFFFQDGHLTAIFEVLHDSEYFISWHDHGQYGNGPKLPFQKLQKELQTIFGNLVRHARRLLDINHSVLNNLIDTAILQIFFINRIM